MTVVGTLEAELKADPKLWEAAMVRATESMERLASRAEKSGQKLRAISSESAVAAKSLASLQDSARQLGERFSKIGAVTGGMGAAFQSAVPQMQGAVGAAAGLAQSFAAGGPLLAGMALVSAAIGALASKWGEARKAADEAVQASIRRMAELDQRVQRSADALEALRTGSSVGVITLRREEQTSIANTQSAATAFAAVVREEFGGKMPTMQTIEAMDGVTKSGTRVADAFRALEAAAAEQRRVQLDLANTVFQEQLKEVQKPAATEAAAKQGLNTLIQSEDFVPTTPLAMQALVEGNFELAKVYGQLEANSDSQVASLLRRLDAERDRLEIEAELADSSEEIARSAEAAARALKEASIAERERAANIASIAGEAVSAVGAGRGGTLALSAGLQAAGSAASIALGDPTGMIGGAIGGALGGILGPMADELMASMGTFAPMFDGLAVLVSTLVPVFGVVGALASRLGEVFTLLAPSILAVAQLLAAGLVQYLRWFELSLVSLNVVLAVLAPVLQLVAEGFTRFVNVLDTYVMSPLVSLVVGITNSIIGAINFFVDVINKAASKFGIDLDIDHLEEVAEPQSMRDMGIVSADLTKAMDDNTNALREFTRSANNLPAGFRYALAEYRSETPDGRGVNGSGRREMRRGDGGGITVMGNLTVMAQTSAVFEEIRRNMRQRGVLFGGPSGATPDRKN